MKLHDLIHRRPPTPWECGEKIPWNDSNFSRRMLECHLAQDHDWASRRYSIIDRHVRWIADHLPDNACVIDLGCGPGFYTHRLAERGCDCIGVDFSPASIEYARKVADENGLEIEYVQDDIRQFISNRRADCILLTFGEFNVFKESDAVAILDKISKHLKPDGIFVLEGHTFDAVQEGGHVPATWQTLKHGLFSDLSHLYLQEHFWDEPTATATTRYFIVDAQTSHVSEYASSMKAYSDSDYLNMLQKAGFQHVDKLDDTVWPTGDEFKGEFKTFVCKKNDPSVWK